MRRRPPLSASDLLSAPERADAPEGLVGGHLAARARQRRLLMACSVISLVAIALLANTLIQHAPIAIAPH